MCLILFSYRTHPRYSLILAANRDEFFERPTEPAGFWADSPEILGGRDRQAGGTWMAVRRDGRWAAVTNFRDGTRPPLGSRSRGDLVAEYLRGEQCAKTYAATIQQRRNEFGGFNLLVGDSQGVVFVSSQLPESLSLEPGLYGLSNHLLDSPWPKVERGKRELHELVNASNEIPADALLELLADRQMADESSLPRTGVSPEWERTLSAAFISAPGYGTRASSVLLMDAAGAVQFRERSFAEQGLMLDDRRFDFVTSAERGTT
jgi:uncharacterized protein with NRDE domain